MCRRHHESVCEVRLDAPPAGYALESATEGQTAHVAVREFTSSEDGKVFISRLEGIPQQLLSLLPPQFSPVLSIPVPHRITPWINGKTASEMPGGSRGC
jgi:hypothetical protein